MRALLILLTALALAACEQAPAPHEPLVKHDHEGDEHEHENEIDAKDVLRVSPEMLHDLRLTTATVEARASGESITALGDLGVNEDRYAEVGTAVNGRVAKVLIAAGDHVEAGQPLVELQSAEVGKVRAEHLRAQASWQLVSRSLARKRALAEEHIVPQRDVQEAEAQASAAAAELAATTAMLKALGIDEAGEGSSWTLRSPIPGMVIERNAIQGRLVDPSHTLVRVGDLSRLWLTAHVFERDAGRIQVGAPARVSFAALPGRPFGGNVTAVGKQVDVQSRTVPVRIEVADADGVLRPGMSATVWVSLEDKGNQVFAVPTASLQRQGNGWCVFLPRAEGLFEMRPVGRGRDLGGEVEVLHGLAAGETVVVDGAFLLRAEADRAKGEASHHAH